jgi:hypothetical protein
MLVRGPIEKLIIQMVRSTSEGMRTRQMKLRMTAIAQPPLTWTTGFF